MKMLKHKRIDKACSIHLVECYLYVGEYHKLLLHEIAFKSIMLSKKCN